MQKYWPEKRCHDKENIWYALNQVTKEEVILKYFSMSNCDEYKVSREAYTMKYLHNEDPKHFLEMYDYMEDKNEDQYMIAMEKADCSLEDIVNERGRLSEEEAIPILREILFALQVMHKNNFIHRDLKLSNILLSSRNDLTSIKIIDFGETVDRNDDYHITGMVGTLYYMAPEILKKKKYGKAVDIWAFGVIAYRLLTGYFPYISEEGNHSKQLKAILNNDVSYLCTDEKRLSIKAIDFINCILNPEPNDRMGIQTALEHPFLNPNYEGEFVPYKPIPKFSKKMSKENIKIKTKKSMNMKDLFNKAVKMTKSQDIIGESGKIIKNFLNKDEDNKEGETEPDKTNATEEENLGNNNNIGYSKTCVQSNHKNRPLSYSYTTYQNGSYVNGDFKNKHDNNGNNDNNIPEYLNVTLGRTHSKPHVEPIQTAGNVVESQVNYNNNNNNTGNVNQPIINIEYSPSYSSSNSPNNINNNNNSAGNVNEPQLNINYSPSYSPSNYNNSNSNGASPIKYSKSYSSSNNNANKQNQINYSKTLATPKLPKTAGNSIDAYQPIENYDYNNNSNNLSPQKLPKTAGNSIGAYQPIQNYDYDNNSNNLSPQKLPKTAGNSIDAYQPVQNYNYDNNPNNLSPTKIPKTDDYSICSYEEFEAGLNNSKNGKPVTRRNRSHSDSTRPYNNTEEYYQNYPNYGTLPMNRNNNNGNYNNYNNNNDNNSLNQYNAKYGCDLRKSNTYSGDPRARNRKPVDNLHENYNFLGVNSNSNNGSGNSQSRHRRTSSSSSGNPIHDNDSNSHHRRTSSSGSNSRNDDSNSHHRRTSSSGSNPDYIKTSQISKIDISALKMSPLENPSIVKSPNSMMDNYNTQYTSKKPSPLANATTIQTSNNIDEKYKQSLKNEIPVSSPSKEKVNEQDSNFNNAIMINSSKGKKADNEKNDSKKSKNIIKNFKDIKLKVNIPKKSPKIIVVETTRPKRNSSLFKTKK